MGILDLEEVGAGGRARQDVHVESEVPPGMFLPTGTLWWISYSTLTIL